MNDFLWVSINTHMGRRQKHLIRSFAVEVYGKPSKLQQQFLKQIHCNLKRTFKNRRYKYCVIYGLLEFAKEPTLNPCIHQAAVKTIKNSLCGKEYKKWITSQIKSYKKQQCNYKLDMVSSKGENYVPNVKITGKILKCYLKEKTLYQFQNE